MISIKRKIIRQGHDTLTITLPKPWCKKYGVGPSGDLEVMEQGDILNIVPPKNRTLPEIVVDVRGLPPMLIWRHVTSAYRSGYDEFRVTFDNPHDKKRYSAFSYDTMGQLYTKDGSKEPVLSPLEVVQMAINRCVGVEIIDQKDNCCLVKELGETTYKEFDNALRRLFLLLFSFSEQITESMKKNGDKDLLKTVDLIDTNIDRFSDFCLRVLNKKGYVEFRKTPTMYTIIFTLELIGDEMKSISNHIIDAKKITPKIEGPFKNMCEKLRKFYGLFYTFDREACKQIYWINNKGQHSYSVETFNSLNNDEKEILHHIKKINMHISSLTGLRIDMEY